MSTCGLGLGLGLGRLRLGSCLHGGGQLLRVLAALIQQRKHVRGEHWRGHFESALSRRKLQNHWCIARYWRDHKMMALWPKVTQEEEGVLGSAAVPCKLVVKVGSAHTVGGIACLHARCRSDVEPWAAPCMRMKLTAMRPAMRLAEYRHLPCPQGDQLCSCSLQQAYTGRHTYTGRMKPRQAGSALKVSLTRASCSLLRLTSGACWRCYMRRKQTALAPPSV